MPKWRTNEKEGRCGRGEKSKRCRVHRRLRISVGLRSAFEFRILRQEGQSVVRKNENGGEFSGKLGQRWPQRLVREKGLPTIANEEGKREAREKA